MGLEFTGLRKDTSLVSIGLVSEDGREFYAEATDYEPILVDQWLKDNVISKLKYQGVQASPLNGEGEIVVQEEPVVNEENLPFHIYMCDKSSVIAQSLREWFAQFDFVEIWCDVYAYDWVVFCDLFGTTAFDIPANIYYIPFDLATAMRMCSVNPDLNREGYVAIPEVNRATNQHNALWDAKIQLLTLARLQKKYDFADRALKFDF